nr:hypothetical protein [uncultured Flavobacterium sp.]
MGIIFWAFPYGPGYSLQVLALPSSGCGLFATIPNADVSIRRLFAKKLDDENQSQDYRMICTNKNALFVKDRVLELEKVYLKTK